MCLHQENKNNYSWDTEKKQDASKTKITAGGKQEETKDDKNKYSEKDRRKNTINIGSGFEDRKH